VDSIYLSPELPRVPLVSEDDLRAAAAVGLLEESHFLDLKREIKAGRSENRELARDLASFAIDSGTLIVGVDEVADGTLQLVPQPLTGLAERIEQVAAMSTDPPLPVVTRRIASMADPAVGYLVVHVPASPSAPHMIDGRYLGRGDKTKRYLSDPEVVRLHERRRSSTADIAALLDEEFARDPIPHDLRRQAHLFLLAEPLAGRSEMLLHLTSGNGWEQRLLSYATGHATNPEVQRALAETHSGGFSPDFDSLRTFDRRPGGVALTSYPLEPGRVLRTDVSDPESVAELEVHEDGGLRLFMSRLSDHIGSGFGEAADHVFFDVAAVTYARRLVGLAVGAAEEVGYFGNWGLALGATGLRGTSSYIRRNSFYARPALYSGDVYQRVTVASYAELSRQPGAVADRLVGQLLRSFGTRQAFDAALEDKDASE
jgi:hypothetical protein